MGRKLRRLTVHMICRRLHLIRSVLHPEIDCKGADWSRANHLGVTKTGEFNQYRWELPYFNDDRPRDCVFRNVFK